MAVQRINNLTIAGFKSIRQTELELGPLNLLIGPNGAGKSNLASLFRLLQSVATERFQFYVARAGGANALLHHGAKRTQEIFIRVSLESVAGEKVYEAKLLFAGERLLIGEAIRTPPMEYRMIAGSAPESRYAQDAANNRGDGLEVFKLFAQCRVHHFHDTTPEARIRQHCDIDDNRVLHGDGRNLAAFLYKLQEARAEYYQLIVRHVRLVAPFFQTFALAPSALNPRTITLRWREAGSDEEFGVHVLSDGTLRFIALAALLLQPPEDLPAIVVIDEPELGLHPYAISVLASLLKQASHNCQVIVATQSPGLLDHFEPEDVVVVDRVNGATEFRRPSPEQLAEWLEEYTLSELWDKNVLGGRPSR